MKCFGNRCRRRDDDEAPQWAKNLEGEMIRLAEAVIQLNQKVERFMSTESAGQAQIDADVQAIEANLASFESGTSSAFATLSQAISKLQSGQTPPTSDNLSALNQLVADVQAATSQAAGALATAISQASPSPASP